MDIKIGNLTSFGDDIICKIRVTAALMMACATEGAGKKQASGLWEEFGAASTFLASDLVVCSYKA